MKIQYYKYCLRCGRMLKKEETRKIGYGAICLQKIKTEGNHRRLFTISPK